MFLDFFGSTSALFFPVVGNSGSLNQVTPDNTQVILTFTGTPYAPGESTLGIEQSYGPSGPWTVTYQAQYTLNGTTIAPQAINLPGPYYEGIYFRYRWENVTLGYVGPNSAPFAGPTTKLRWDVTTAPIAPTAIVSSAYYNGGFGADFGIDVEVEHSLANSDNYSNKGILVSATGLVGGFPQTHSTYFVGWGASVGADEVYRVSFGTQGGSPITLVTAASAQYYVLGDPLPGILGAIVNQ